MKFSAKDFFSKCDQICSIGDLATFAEEIFNGKLHFLCNMLNVFKVNNKGAKTVRRRIVNFVKNSSL